MLAGHDTTALSLTWWAWELAKNPEWQMRLRDEIKQTRAKVQERGDGDFSVQDLEGMSAMHATLKVCLASLHNAFHSLPHPYVGGYATPHHRLAAC
jgi:cytochrome P450